MSQLMSNTNEGGRPSAPLASRPYTMSQHRVALGRDLSRRSFLGGAGVLAASAALAGCGSYSSSAGSDAAGSDASASSAATASSGDPTKITFCLDYTPNTNHTGIYVAQDKGYFEDEGLTVEIVQPAEDTAESMLGSGQAQLGVSYQDYIANALAADNPLPIQALAAVIQHNTSGIMSRKEDGITRARYMEGHVYDTWNLPVEQATIKQVVESDGGDFSKVQMVAVSADDEVSGLKADMFDCVWVFEGWAVQNAKIQDYPVNYFSFISMDDVFDFYTPVIAGNDDFCKQNPDVVEAFLRAVKKGYEYAVENPEDAAKSLLSAAPELSEDLVLASADFLKDQYIADASSWGVIDKDRWATYYQWLNDKDLVENKLDVDSGWDTQYLEA